MGRRSYIAAAVLGALWLASLEAKAAAIVYVDRTLFEAATPTRTNLDFGTLTGGQDFVSYPTGAGPALMGASFRTDPTLPDSVKPQILFALAPSTKYNSVAEGLLASESQYPDFRPMDLLITLPAGVKSVGFDYAGGFTLASVNLSDGETFPVTQPVSPNVNFFGFTSMVNITGVTLNSSSANVLSIGNLSYGTPIPEPTLLGLIGVGVYGLLGRRRVLGIIGAKKFPGSSRPPTPE